MNRWLKGLTLGACIGAASALFASAPLGVALEEGVGLQALLKIRGPVEPPPEVALVALDRRSADAFGLPIDPRDWPRSLHGMLVDRLVAKGASLIVFDLAFVRQRSIEEDTAFAQAIARSRRVILFAGMRKEPQRTPGRRETGSGSLWRERLQMPVPFLEQSALASAPFPLPKASSSVRQFWAFSPDAERTPTLPAVALQALDIQTWLEVIDEAGLAVVGKSTLDQLHAAVAQHLNVVPSLLRRAFRTFPRLEGEVRRVLDERAREGLSDERGRRLLNALADLYAGPDSRYLNLYGPPGTIRTISYHEVIDDKGRARGLGMTALAGAVVFVGLSDRSAPGKDDAFPTVFTQNGVDLSGVEIAATAFANLLTRRVLEPPAPLMTTLVLLAFGAAAAVLACALPATTAVPSALALAAAYAFATQLCFNAADVWAPLAVPLLVELPLVLVIGLLVQYVTTRRQRNRMQRAIDQYVPPRVARELADRPVRPLAMQETAYAVCLAANAENFSALAEGMTPEAAASYLNRYLETVAEAMERHHADVMKFHIDGILYTWTSDRPGGLDVRAKACTAAIATLDAIDNFNEGCAPLRLDVRVGLHAGPAFAGGAASPLVFEAVGAIADTAVRIEELNAQAGTRLVATEATVAGLDDLLARPLGAFVLKGRKAPVSVVEIMTFKSRASMAQLSLCARFAGALEAFQTHQWGEAVERFEAILAAHPDDGPSRFYLKVLPCAAQGRFLAASGCAVRLKAAGEQSEEGLKRGRFRAQRMRGLRGRS